MTEEEAYALEILKDALDLLKEPRGFLQSAYEVLPDPPDAEEMGEGTIPESLAYSLRGDIECALADHLDPLIELLKRALKETPARLARDWRKRQRKGRV